MKKSGPAIATITLPEKLNNAAAAELKSLLQEGRGQPVRIDASETTVLGTQSIQVLMAATSEWASAGQTMDLKNLSGNLLQSLSVLGIPEDKVGLQEVPNDS